MGHALHHLLCNIEIPSLSGVNGVTWDTVEFPSQFLENFAYYPPIIKKLSSHYKTKKLLGNEDIEKLTKYRKFQSALAMVRQLEFAMFDILVHKKPYNQSEVQEILNNVRRDVSVVTPPSYNKFQNGFSHIFSGGYASGYYSYKWAEVLSSDAFLEVTKDDKIDLNLMKRYRDTVLANGSSKDMSELFVDFLGRDKNIESILKLSGICE
jgi:oligopeptidase A